MDDYEIRIDDSTFTILSAIANADDDPKSLLDITDIDPNEFREFLIRCGGIENKDALTLLRLAELRHFPKARVASLASGRRYRRGIKLYVGNLSFRTSSEELQELFSQAGSVESASVIKDRDTGRSRGFGFVEMATKAESEAAIQQFDGKELDGRNLRVNEVKPKGREKPGSGGGKGGHSKKGGRRGDRSRNESRRLPH